MSHQARVAMVDRRNACELVDRLHDERPRSLSILRKMEDRLLHEAERIAGSIAPFEWKCAASDPEMT